MAAFRLAHELGADMVEFDVHLSADDRLVVIHDDTLDRTTNGRGYVRDQPWSVLARLDAGGWYDAAPPPHPDPLPRGSGSFLPRGSGRFSGERIPRLEDTLEWARSVSMPVSIEMKRPNAALGRAAYPGLAQRVVSTVRAYGLQDQAIVFSDDHALVRAARDLAPEIGTAIVMGLGTFIDPIGLTQHAGGDGVALYWRFASRELIERFHAACLHVFGFGVGEDLEQTQGLEAMLANGVDFVSSGQPDRLRAFVDAWLLRTAT